MTDLQRPPMPMRRAPHGRVVTAAAVLFVGACAYPHARETVVHNSHQHQVVGTAGSVVVTDVSDQDHAFPFAEQYCEGRGKTAKFNHMILYRNSSRRVPVESAEFDCVLTDGSRST